MATLQVTRPAGGMRLGARHAWAAASRPRPAARAPARRTGAVCSAKSAVILPGLGNAARDYDTLKSDLETRGLSVRVADVRRVDWLRNARGALSMDYWRGTLKPRPTVDWYLERIDAAVKEAKAGGSDTVTLIAHSAGGWLARVYMLEYGTDDIDVLLTLGSPHQPPPKDIPGTIDQTRGLLDYCSTAMPGAFHDDVRYITVSGRYIEGAELGQEAPLKRKVVGLGYQQVCGEATVWGDGITPEPSAHLEGAEQVLIKGVYHSPVGPGPWYGSEGFLEQWVQCIL